MLSALLAIFWWADLCGLLPPLICFSGASSSFGFGASILKTSDGHGPETGALGTERRTHLLLWTMESEQVITAKEWVRFWHWSFPRCVHTRVQCPPDPRLPHQSLGGRSFDDVALDLGVINAACVSSCHSVGFCGLSGRPPREDNRQGPTQFCMWQLLSSCSVTLWCVGFWCHRRRILATFCQEDAGVCRHRATGSR